MLGPCITYAAEKPGTQPWALQVIQRPVVIIRDQAYRLRFRARSDRPRSLEVNVGTASQPWDSEVCAEGGTDVGWIDACDILTYRLNVKKPGAYQLGLRHAGETATGRTRL